MAHEHHADHLLGAGDAYAVVPGRVQRVQLAIVCIGHQTGQFTEYAERWELLADLVEAAHVSL